MTDDPHLNLSDDMIRELAQRLADHLRVELGDRLTPFQRAYATARDLERQYQKNIEGDAEALLGPFASPRKR